MTTSLSGSDETSEILVQQGLDAFFAGDRTRALRLLVRAIESNPDDEQAWLGLARIVTTPGRRRYCLERALSINPHNLRTRSALREIRGEADFSKPVSPATAVSNASTDQAVPLLDAPPITERARAVGENAPTQSPSVSARNDGMSPLHCAAPSHAELTPFSLDHLEQFLHTTSNGPSSVSAGSNRAEADARVSAKHHSTPAPQPMQLRPVRFVEDMSHMLATPYSLAGAKNSGQNLDQLRSVDSPDRSLSMQADAPVFLAAPTSREIAATLRSVGQHDPAYRFQVFGALFFFGALSMLLFVMLLLLRGLPVV